MALGQAFTTELEGGLRLAQQALYQLSLFCTTLKQCIANQLFYLDSVCTIVEESDSSNGAENGIRGIVNHIVSSHRRQRLSLREQREESIRGEKH